MTGGQVTVEVTMTGVLVTGRVTRDQLVAWSVVVSLPVFSLYSPAPCPAMDLLPRDPMPEPLSRSEGGRGGAGGGFHLPSSQTLLLPLRWEEPSPIRSKASYGAEIENHLNYIYTFIHLL